MAAVPDISINRTSTLRGPQSRRMGRAPRAEHPVLALAPGDAVPHHSRRGLLCFGQFIPKPRCPRQCSLVGELSGWMVGGGVS